ncbi:MAG: TolB family protein [Acidobacteriota bacterium]
MDGDGFRNNFYLRLLVITWLSLALMRAQTTEQINWRIDEGAVGVANCRTGDLSSDGRFVVFTANYSAVYSNNSSNFHGVFRYDRKTGQTILVSASSSGTAGNNSSGSPSISGDGRYVCFSSFANNLVAGDTNNFGDVFVRDCVTGQTERVSLSSTEAQILALSTDPIMSSDGRYVFFESLAVAGLPSADPNWRTILVRDRQEGVTKVAATTAGNAPIRTSPAPSSVSGDGRYLAFRAMTQSVDASEMSGANAIWVKDMVSGALILASRDRTGLPMTPGTGFQLSRNGRYVVFPSNSGQLVPGEASVYEQIFVRDIQTGTSSRVSINSAGQQADSACSFPVISGDGRYVVFQSSATNLLPGVSGGLYLKDRHAGKLALVSTGLPSNGWNGGSDPKISEDGQAVIFTSEEGWSFGGQTLFLRNRPAEAVLATFPHYANGSASARTRIILMNGGNSADTGEVRFRDSQGNPLGMPVNGQIRTAVPYALGPFGTTEIATDGTGPLLSGSVQVVSDRGFESLARASLVFDVFGKFVSVDPCPPWTVQRFFASRNASENTGLALQNPGPYRLVSRVELHTGKQALATALLPLEPGSQIALFLDDPPQLSVLRDGR